MKAARTTDKPTATSPLRRCTPSIEKRLQRAARALVLCRAACASRQSNGEIDDDLFEALEEQIEAALTEIRWLEFLPGFLVTAPAPDCDDFEPEVKTVEQEDAAREAATAEWLRTHLENREKSGTR